MLTPPTTIRGRYRLLDRLGSGGLADVYRGEDLLLERPVAVKVVRSPEAVNAQPFAREITALARLTHPAIVRLFDGGTDGRLAFLVMELVDGRPLDAILAGGGRLDPDRVRTIGREVADALAHAHAADCVHRDVKPGNILLDETGRVRVTDFGVARIVDETVTTTGGTFGTAAYVAPEQVDSGRVGPAADVYALGLVLLECLTGRRAFPGGVTESAVARLTRDPPIPDALPEPWPGLLRAMTHRDPDRRPTAAAVARHLQTPTRPAPPSVPPDAGTRTQALARLDGEPQPRPGTQDNRRLALLVIVLAALAVWLFLHSEEPAGDEATPAGTIEQPAAVEPPQADEAVDADEPEDAVREPAGGADTAPVAVQPRNEASGDQPRSGPQRRGGDGPPPHAEAGGPPAHAEAGGPPPHAEARGNAEQGGGTDARERRGPPAAPAGQGGGRGRGN